MAEFSQMGMFDASEPLRIANPIRIIQLFAGYGSQALALKYLGADYEHWTCSEWAIPSIRAYYDMHFGNNQIDYSEGMSQEDLVNFFTEHSISADYSNPLTADKLRKRKDLRDLYNMGMASKNKFSICGMTGKDLNIVDTDNFTYILTWSFPCQDLSVAGKMAGMSKDSGTRSSLAFEVIRLLQECDKKPQILLMENVPQVCNDANFKAFSEILAELQHLGYQNKWQILDGTEYGMPQSRHRCFMVSWLDNSYYDFPTPIGNDLRLKDVFEKQVDERYYLSLSKIQKMAKWHSTYNPLEHIQGTESVSPTLGAKAMANDNSQMLLYSDGLASETNIRKDYPNITIRVRKYTERECFKLMGVKGEDFDRIESNQSASGLYHLAGDSIITSCMMAIFGEMIGCDWKGKVEELQRDLQNQSASG